MRQQKKRITAPTPKRAETLQGGQVGIIFLLDHQVLIESTPVAQAEAYGDCLNHRRGHEKLWADLQSSGLASEDEDYITIPRGRVIFSTQTGQYTLLLDRCILRQPKLVREIRQRMNLPRRGLVMATDDHYRCAVCMNKISF